MISDSRCFYCFARAFEKLLEKEKLSVEAKNYFVRDMVGLYNKVQGKFSAPLFSRELHIILKQYTNNPDPYMEVKRHSNDMVLAMYPDLKKQILLSDNPFDTALRLAIAGNIIDFAAGDNFDIQATIDKVLHSDFTIDHSNELKKALSKARTVLYLGDNTGEIVFDKLFIEHIMHPNLFYAVRGAPIINDATMDDAKYVGMDIVANVISNGYDAPSTTLERCSAEFKEVFCRADVIISKGQGNLEGLLEKSTGNIYFLLIVKCDVIAKALHVKKGGYIVKYDDKVYEDCC